MHQKVMLTDFRLPGFLIDLVMPRLRRVDGLGLMIFGRVWGCWYWFLDVSGVVFEMN
jgi:hypothetical protein